MLFLMSLSCLAKGYYAWALWLTCLSTWWFLYIIWVFTPIYWFIEDDL